MTKTIRILAACVGLMTYAANAAQADIRNSVEKQIAREQKIDLQPGAAMKKLFKDFRPGSCKTAAQRAPNGSWQPRGESAVSFCKP